MSKFKIAFLGMALAVGASVASLSGCATGFEQLSGAEVTEITYVRGYSTSYSGSIEGEENIAEVLKALDGVTLTRTTDTLVYGDVLQLTLHYSGDSIGVSVSKTGQVGVLCGISYYASDDGAVDYSLLLESLEKNDKN